MKLFPTKSSVRAAYNSIVRKRYVAIQKISKAQYGRHISILSSALLIMLLVGCSTQRQVVTQLVHDIRTDTIYLNSKQYDSIYIYQDRLLDRSKDTVYLKDISIEYRYKLLRDTVKVIQCDSIPYEVTVIETKETCAEHSRSITRPLTWFDKTCRACFFLLLGAIIFCLIRYIRVRL